MNRRASWVVPVLALLASACTKPKAEELPPLGEVLVAVDTDVAVPTLAGRLRVDMFTDQGVWFQSRDIARSNVVDWPLSFSVYTDDLVNDKLVLLRLRSYPEGALRDYLGERYAERAPYAPPTAAKSLSALCASAPELTLDRDLVLRKGRDLLTAYVPGAACTQDPQGGAVAAKIQIQSSGVYRLGTSATFPANVLTNAFLRKRCDDPSTQLGCAGPGQPAQPGGLAFNTLSSMVLPLDPGTYYLFAGGYNESPLDITLHASVEAPGAASDTGGAPGSTDPGPAPSPLPRYLEDGRDVTRTDEPEPGLAIDRLLLVRVHPGTVAMAQVTLHGACLGTMARLSQVASFHDPVIAEAQTCLDAEAVRVAVIEAPTAPKESLGASLQGSFPPAGDPCPAADASSDVVCLPSGVFRLGSPLEGPERAALMSRFWLDRNEVTVARFRAALAGGFQSPDATPLENNTTLGTSSKDGSVCTWSAAARPAAEEREGYALSCVSWYAARAFCKFNGGDLPTEAQWTYAATAVGRDHETALPWGGDTFAATPCSRAVFGRNDSSPSGPAGPEVACAATGYGPLSVTARAGTLGDVTPTYGIIGLGGGVTEWALDSYRNYDSACWNAVSLQDPACLEDDAPARDALGRGWADALGDMSLRKTRGTPVTAISDIGFRCAYAKAQTP